MCYYPDGLSAMIRLTILQKKTYQTKNQLASFHYQYDALDNLVRMTCSSTSTNALCPRDMVFKNSGLKNAPVITEQNYYFTPLNRLSSVHEQLQNPLQQQTLSKVTNYRYTDNSAPLLSADNKHKLE